MRIINAAGLALLKKWERLELSTYLDQGGVPTIGFGHTGPEVELGQTITMEQAEQLLQQDLEKFYALNEYCSETVNDNQYSALICLAFNVGFTAVRNSVTLKLVNAGEDPDQEWLGFCHVNGTVSQGLINRRKAELTLYHTVG